MPRGQTTRPAALSGLDGPSVVASEGKEILGTESTTIIRFGSYSDVTCILLADRYYLEVKASLQAPGSSRPDRLACFAWLALWPASLASPGQLEGTACATRTATRPAALSGLDGPSGTTARLSHFCWTASSVVTQTQALTHSSFARLCLVIGPPDTI